MEMNRLLSTTWKWSQGFEKFVECWGGVNFVLSTPLHLFLVVSTWRRSLVNPSSHRLRARSILFELSIDDLRALSWAALQQLYSLIQPIPPQIQLAYGVGTVLPTC